MPWRYRHALVREYVRLVWKSVESGPTFSSVRYAWREKERFYRRTRLQAQVKTRPANSAKETYLAIPLCAAVPAVAPHRHIPTDANIRRYMHACMHACMQAHICRPFIPCLPPQLQWPSLSRGNISLCFLLLTPVRKWVPPGDFPPVKLFSVLTVRQGRSTQCGARS